jgi:SAM-dependent methyltransferase
VPSLARFAHRVLGTRQVNQLVRFVPVLDAISTMPTGLLLDVGSGSTGIGPLLPHGWTVVSLDADFMDYGAVVTSESDATRVLGDVRRLPFPDRTFDAVVAVDLLEHVSPPDRASAIAELCRVASRRAVIACPTGQPAIDADTRIRDALLARGSSVPPWLDEHLRNGFPERQDLVDEAQRHGRTNVLGNESTAAHERVTLAELRAVTGVPLRVGARLLAWGMGTTAPDKRGHTIAASVVRRLGGHDREPTYRSVVCVDLERLHNCE